MNLQQIVALILSLSKYFPLQDLMALFGVLTPLPSIHDSAAVTTWLNNVSIGGPLKTTILDIVNNLPSATVPTPVKSNVTLRMVQVEIARQSESLDHVQAFDPATMLKLAEFILSLLPLFGL